MIIKKKLINKFKNLIIFNYLNYYFYLKKIKKNKLKKKLKKNIYPKISKNIHLMPSTIWNKYKLIKEISSNSGIKTYSARLEPIIKEIIPKDKDDYQAISERLEQLKAQLDIYEIIEEDYKFYIVAENNEKLLSKIDKLILSNESTTKKEIHHEKSTDHFKQPQEKQQFRSIMQGFCRRC